MLRRWQRTLRVSATAVGQAARRGGVRGAGTRGRRLRPAAALLALGLLAAAPAVTLATGQAGARRSFPSDTETLPIDVTVRVVDGTTRQPGHADAVTLQEVGQRAQPIASASDVTGETVLRGLFLDETRSYLVQATIGGIPYFARATGQELAGGPITVYVFATTTDRSAVVVSELNLVVKRVEKRLDLEYMIAIANETSPQQTILPDPVSFELLLPQDASGETFEVLGGTGPTKITPVAGAKDDRTGLAFPLRSGTTRLRVSATVPYAGRARLQLGASAPVRAFTLLVSPDDLEVSGDFKDLGPAEPAGFHRWEGPAVAANAMVTWQVSGGTGPRIAARQGGRLSDVGRKAQERIREARQDRTAFTVSIVGLVVVIALLVLRHRLRPPQ